MSMSKSRLHQLSELGQSVWIDFLSREMLQTGELERLMRDDAVVGITSNPTIFQKAISQGDLYDEQIRASLPQVGKALWILGLVALNRLEELAQVIPVVGE